jgi:alpha-ketoglutaric semialdehyde dehydrogenase
VGRDVCAVHGSGDRQELTNLEASNFIGGEWQASLSGRTYEKRNPFRPSELVGTFPASDERDLDAAVTAAGDAFLRWRDLTPQRRSEFLLGAAEQVVARVDEIAADMTREMGKPIRESRAEVARGAETLRFCAGEAWRAIGEVFANSATGGHINVLRRPLGVVGLITPWNFPWSIPLWKAAPALIYGNTVVLKPAQEAPRTAQHLAQCFADAGLPSGVFNVVIGRGSEVGTPLVTHEQTRAISFTGSVPIGRHIRELAVARDKRVQLELGGHSPLVVLADADLDRAAEAAFAGAFWSAGQKCTATRRIYVQDDVYATFKARFLTRIRAGAVGDPTSQSTEVGPLVNETQMNEILDAVKRGRDERGTVVIGGERQTGDGYVVLPTVFENVADDAYLSCEEVFGPVTTLYPVASLDEAIERANGTPFGLSAAIFTSSLASVNRFVARVEAGVLRVNSATAGGEPHVPFGGSKSSGYGPREQGRAAREFYTETATIYLND